MSTFIRQEKIRFQHIDYAGIVFYPRYLEMLNGLVEDWFADELDSPFHVMHETHGIPTVDLKVQFKKPARLGETLTKSLWVKKIGGSSIICGFNFQNEAEETCLEGEVTLVHVAFSDAKNSIKSAAFSDTMRAKIEQFYL